MFATTYDHFDDLSIYAFSHYQRYADVLDDLPLCLPSKQTFTITDELPAPAECVMRKTFDELVQYSLNIPQIDDLFANALTWGSSDYTSGHGWAMRDYFNEDEDGRKRYEWNEYPKPRIVAGREWRKRFPNAPNNWVYATHKHTIMRTKGYRDVCFTKKGKFVKSRHNRFMEVEDRNKVLRGTGHFYTGDGGYAGNGTASRTFLYRKNFNECACADWTRPDGTPIVSGRGEARTTTNAGTMEATTEFYKNKQKKCFVKHSRAIRNAMPAGHPVFQATLYDELVAINYNNQLAYHRAYPQKKCWSAQNGDLAPYHHRIHEHTPYQRS